MLILSPINFGLAEILGKEPSMLLHYVLAMGLTLWIVSAINGNTTGEISFVFTVKNTRVIPLIILTTIALLVGIISPIHGSANLCGFSVRLFFANTDSVFDATVFDMYDGIANLIAVVLGSIMMISICVHFLNREFKKETTNTRPTRLPD